MGALVLQSLDDLEKVADRAGETIETDHNQHVARTDLLEKARELGPGPGSARAVFLKNRRAAGRPQFVRLWVGRLVFRRNTRVAEQARGHCRALQWASSGTT